MSFKSAGAYVFDQSKITPAEELRKSRLNFSPQSGATEIPRRFAPLDDRWKEALLSPSTVAQSTTPTISPRAIPPLSPRAGMRGASLVP